MTRGQISGDHLLESQVPKYDTDNMQDQNENETMSWFEQVRVKIIFEEANRKLN